MRPSVAVLGCLLIGLGGLAAHEVQAEDDQLAYAVVSEVPKDKAKVPAKVAVDGTVSDTKLLASESTLGNLIWKKLEICHALRLEGRRAGDGFHVSSVRAIDASLLPMVLQGFAGDCLLKKALDVAPLVD